MSLLNGQLISGSTEEPTSTVEISISCRSLPDKDTFSRSDPMCVIFHQTPGSTKWIELIRTEIIWDCLDPDFMTKIVMDYTFEQEQFLRFEIYDIDSPSPDLEQHDFLGCAECKLGQIVSAGYKSLQLPLFSEKYGKYESEPKGNNIKNYKGKIYLLAEELVQLKEEITLKLEGSLMCSKYLGLIPPKLFYALYKSNEAGTWTLVYRSEPTRGENPKWKTAIVPMRNLCNGDKDRGLKIECYKVGLNGYHKLLGSSTTTVNQLLELVNGGGTEGLSLFGKRGKKKVSKLKVSLIKIAPLYTFTEYIRSGTKIHCCFAIDFTSSNGDPRSPTSLHYLNPTVGRTNPYEQAIRAVGDIIQDYDSTKMFPVYGFGAKLPPNGEVSHHFPVTLSGSPFCNGIDDVLGQYRHCLKRLQLSEPTNFAPIISDVAQLARSNMNGQHYYVLLIITDGIITDMALTKEAIINAAILPMSILIVGVGQADFKQMVELDGDTVRLSHNGITAARDIVQFVPYRDLYTWTATAAPLPSDGTSMDEANYTSNFESRAKLAKAKLAREVLAEIPDQLTGFMKSCGLKPQGR